MPVIAVALFINPQGEVLMHLRDDKPEILFPNQWSLIGGHVEDGETPDDALIREVQEEIGQTLTEYKLLATFYDGDYTRHLYTAPLDIAASAIHLTEGQMVRFVDPHRALRELDVCLTGRRALDVYLNHLEWIAYMASRTRTASTGSPACN